MTKLSQHAQSSFFSFSQLHHYPSSRCSLRCAYMTSFLIKLLYVLVESRPPHLRLSPQCHPLTTLHLPPSIGRNAYSLVQSGARRSAYSVSFTGACQQLAQPLRRVASSANANAMHMHDTHSVTPPEARLDRPKLGYAGYNTNTLPEKMNPAYRPSARPRTVTASCS
jgi:hypothetical protein